MPRLHQITNTQQRTCAIRYLVTNNLATCLKHAGTSTFASAARRLALSSSSARSSACWENWMPASVVLRPGEDYAFYPSFRKFAVYFSRRFETQHFRYLTIIRNKSLDLNRSKLSYRYCVKSKLGWGSFSTVWRCEDQEEGCSGVAVKVVQSEKTATAMA